MAVMAFQFLSLAILWILLSHGSGNEKPSEKHTNIYLSGITEEMVLNSLHYAEDELRIFIYNSSDVFRPIEIKNSLKHFRSEYLFVDYLQMISESNEEGEGDHRKKMIVTKPEHANVFLIEHKVFNGKFDSVDEMVLYLRAVVDRVVDELPYYKLHGGKDHYFFGVHSNGKIWSYLRLIASLLQVPFVWMVGENP